MAGAPTTPASSARSSRSRCGPRSPGLRAASPLPAARAARFTAAFAITLALLVGLTGLFVLRLQALGEVLSDGDGANLRGTLFADYAAYKLGQAVRRHPEVLVLGSSRVMSIRAGTLARCPVPSCFYNAGGGAPDLRTALDFVRELTAAGAAPGLLVLGLDFWDLNDAFPQVGADRPEPVRRDGIEGLRYALGITGQVTSLALRDGRVRGVLASAPPDDGRRGLAAVLDGAGFLPDGSYRYGRTDLAEFAASPGVDRVDYAGHARDCGYRFECPDGPSARALGHLDELLGLLERAGTTVIVYTPVVSDSVSDALRARQPTLFPDLWRWAGSVSRTHHAAFVPLERGSDLGCGPAEFFDGIHPSQVCEARLMLRLSTDALTGPLLEPYVDRDALRAMISATRSPLLLEPADR